MAIKENRIEERTGVRCTICGETKWDFVRQGRDLYRPQDVTNFKVSRCISCGHVMQTPLPSDDVLREAYSVDYGPYRLVWREPGWPLWKILRELATWRRMLCLKRYGEGRKLLEVGSGSGDFLYAAHRAGWDVSAVEYNPNLADTLRTELGLDARAGELRPGLWKEGEFDVIAFWNVFEHLKNPLETLITVSSYLRSGGALFLQIPTLYGIEGGRWFGQYWAQLDLPRHLNFFSRTSLTQLCDRAGMELNVFETPFLGTAWCYYGSIRNYAKWSKHAAEWLLRFTLPGLVSVAVLPYAAARAWRGHGSEAFALAIKK